STSLNGVALNGGLIERLYQETEGLPFFLIEYLLAIINGALPVESENWSPPGSVRELLHSRLKAVDETGRQLLGAAAVIGRSFDFDTLREVSGRGEEETVNALAAEYFKLAGDHARSLYANAEALTHYRMALALGYTDAAILHESVGDLYTLLGEYSNAIKSYETAAALCAPTALANVEHKLGNV